MSDESPTPQSETFHRFLDETGDTTFYGKGRKLIVGQDGVSLSFGLGVVRIDRPLEEVRREVRSLEAQVEADPLLNPIPRVQKRVASGGFFFHACKDTPDVRAVLLRYLRELPCEAEMVVARKIPALFEKQHHGREEEFYADLLAHLIKNRLKRAGTLVLNVAERGSSTREKVLTDALRLATERAAKKWGGGEFAGANGVQRAEPAHRTAADGVGLSVLGGTTRFRAGRGAALQLSGRENPTGGGPLRPGEIRGIAKLL